MIENKPTTKVIIKPKETRVSAPDKLLEIDYNV